MKPQKNISPSGDGVVLLHGIFRTRRSMRSFERYLQKHGYRTLSISYPSRRKPIEDIVHHIHPMVQEFAASLPGKVHFIGHSMGGLVIRAYLHRHMPANSGRVVMLGVPNQGNEIADYFKDWRLYRKLYGPAGQQLTTTFEHAGKMFGTVNYEVGVIAGRFRFELLATLIIREPHDGTVSVKSTRLEGMKDHIVIFANHTYLPVSRRAWKLALAFLREGSFAAAA